LLGAFELIFIRISIILFPFFFIFNTKFIFFPFDSSTLD
jgi:hypothetical protein